MRMHVEALYTHDNRSRILLVNERDGGVAPRFFLGRTKTGNLWRFRDDLPLDLAMALDDICRSEPVEIELPKGPQNQEVYLRVLETHGPVERVWAGPTYWIPEGMVPTVQPIGIDETNADLLSGGLEDWLQDVPHRQPFMGLIEDGHVVSVCSSVRVTEAAHEAGVETIPLYRRKGHALNAVAGWANAVREMGAIPLYSTSWDNIASQNVAARLSMSIIGVDFHIT